MACIRHGRGIGRGVGGTWKHATAVRHLTVDKTAKPYTEFDFYDRSVAEYAAMPSRRMSIKDLLHFGKKPTDARIIRSANYVRQELPRRLARRIYDFMHLPHIVMKNPDLNRVIERYLFSFHAFRRFPPITTMQRNAEFRDLVAYHIDLHLPAIDELRRGVADCRRLTPEVSLSDHIDRMLTTRISRRVIAEFYLALHERREGFAGIVKLDCSPADVLERCAKGAAKLCEDKYGRAPNVRIEGDTEERLAYFQTHLEYIFFEVLKNAMRAVAEHHQVKASLPDITAVIVGGPDGILSIKISDQGGGIHPSILPNIFRYGYSTGGQPQEEVVADDPLSNLNGGERTNNPMYGLGFGLPMSRIYARYVGGNLNLYSVPGYGTDVILQLHRLGDHMESHDI